MLNVKQLMAVSIAALVAGGLGATAPASASPAGQHVPVSARPISESASTFADTTCPQGAVCGWTRPDRGGTRTVHSDLAPGCHAFGAARSVANRSDRHIQLLPSRLGCSGEPVVLLAPMTFAGDIPFPVASIRVYG
ncbi:peptidase inhibitor family I36 protein [Nocardiopsis dassonvillei]|uniref:peptidase inhibitor family I36 protein n=1 Tax=Nocardiopsis dassonvillei TaxID=2014 RepID=UPI002010828F|nr:peptidase inhibitor family I36 protein [Nocardiopsis dassonvillei]MCK9868544.1 peptidase inhibitor family I36 protein [Nocardiopsis dassonvillei]